MFQRLIVLLRVLFGFAAASSVPAAELRVAVLEHAPLCPELREPLAAALDRINSQFRLLRVD